MSKIEVDAIDKQSGSTLTLGGSGTAVTLACGSTQTGFGRTGTVNWDTTVKTASFTAVNGEGYFVNTTSGAITVTLPASPSAGNIVAVQDYAGNITTNNITIARNSSPINGGTDDLTMSENNASALLVYIDGTQGWKVVSTASLADLTEQPSFICATGGTESTTGNFKIHTFTGPGTFTVNSLGNTLGGGSKVSYMVAAGGGGGGVGCAGGGGGAGGFREGKTSCGCYTASPIVAPDGLTVTATAFPITVGGGGSGISPFTALPGGFPSPTVGGSGSTSTFSTISSAGGGGGGGTGSTDGVDGGSGGGGAHSSGSAGNGNVPPVSPSQGFSGANPAPATGPAPSDSGGGGGGATAVAQPAPGGRAGGAGATTSINGTPTAFAGGGGGTNRCGGSASDTAGGTGGGGRGGFGPRPTPAPEAAGVNGTTNTGGGGGGGKAITADPSSRPYGGSGTGGSGIVIIRYKFQ